MYLFWLCDCGKMHVSIDHRHHVMDSCECGKSGVDFETYCCRILGDVEIIKEVDYNFFVESCWNFIEQYPERLCDIQEVKDLEDEILEGML